MKLLAVGSTLILSLATPFTYFFLEYHDGNKRAAFYSQKYALKFKQAIQENPEYWQLNIEKFVELFADIEDGDGIEAIEVYDNGLRLLYRETLLESGILSIQKAAQLRYNNRVYGYVIIYINLAHTLSYTAILLCVFSITTIVVIKLLQTNQKIQNEMASRKVIESILKNSKEELKKKNKELTMALKTLTHTQNKLIQQEKLAGIGQLAAGVAHEINNPLGFVTANVEMLEEYFNTFSSVLAQYRELRSKFAAIEHLPFKDKIDQVMQEEAEKDLDFIMADLPELFRDTVEGLNRMNKIVKGMRLFSRIDQQRVFEQYDLIHGLHSTLLVAQNELKHYATVEKRLKPIPAIEAVGGEINQVLLNLIVNAVQAVKAKESRAAGIIKISTWYDNGFVYCAIEDSGVGIMPANLHSIFNPFFTTKAVGQGTGMGLSISYDIIVNRHNGEILVESSQGNGAKFTIKLPIKHEFTKEDKR
jgi:signal transduction histidine kinase